MPHARLLVHPLPDSRPQSVAPPRALHIDAQRHATNRAVWAIMVSRPHRWPEEEDDCPQRPGPGKTSGSSYCLCARFKEDVKRAWTHTLWQSWVPYLSTTGESRSQGLSLTLEKTRRAPRRKAPWSVAGFACLTMTTHVSPVAVQKTSCRVPKTCQASVCPRLVIQTTPTVRLRSRLTFGSDRHFTQVTKGGVNNPPYSTVIHFELFRITKHDDQSRHTTRRAKINATGFGPWRSRGCPIGSSWP